MCIGAQRRHPALPSAQLQTDVVNYASQLLRVLVYFLITYLFQHKLWHGVLEKFTNKSLCTIIHELTQGKMNMQPSGGSLDYLISATLQ